MFLLLVVLSKDTLQYEGPSIGGILLIMFLCSLLCSSDIIAAVTIVNEEEQPKLFSIVLGEGLFNDAVSIVLFETMREFANPSSDKPAPEHFDAEILWDVICKFLSTTLCSTISDVLGRPP